MTQKKDTISNLRDEGIGFKILAAKFFLEKIPSIVPLEVNVEERLHAEINIESFLFFAIGAIDLLYKKINEKLNLPLPAHAVKLGTLTKELRKVIAKENSEMAKKLLNEFALYTKEPEYVLKKTTKEIASQYAEDNLNGVMGLEFWTRFENRNGEWFEHLWNRKNSSLWELKELRNSTTHGTILSQSREQINKLSRDGIGLKLTRNVQSHHDKYFILDPHEYFVKSLEIVIEYILKIEKILDGKES